MRYFKIPLCQNFHWNAEIDQVKLRMDVGSNDTCQWQLGSKIGVWQWMIIHSTGHQAPNLIWMIIHSTGHQALNFIWMILHSTGHQALNLYEYAWTQQLNQQQRMTSTTWRHQQQWQHQHYNLINIHHLIATSYNHHIISTYIFHIIVHQHINIQVIIH